MASYDCGAVCIIGHMMARFSHTGSRSGHRLKERSGEDRREARAMSQSRLMACCVVGMLVVCLGITWVGVAMMAMWKTSADVMEYVLPSQPGAWKDPWQLWYLMQHINAWAMGLAWLSAGIVATHKLWLVSGFQSYIFMEADVL